MVRPGSSCCGWSRAPLPLAPCVVASFAASYAGHEDVAGYLMSAATATLAIGAALSVLRYRLFDVERVVTDSAAYAIASAAVILIFVGVVVVISRTTPLDPGSQLPTILATLAGVVAARISYVWARRAVGRRINRQRFDAVAVVRSGLAEASPDLDALLRSALHDPRARILYPAAGGAWVTAGRAGRAPRAPTPWRYDGTSRSPPGSTSTRLSTSATWSTRWPTRPPPRSTTWPSGPSWHARWS